MFCGRLTRNIMLYIDMGRHSKKFHNLRAMNENRRAKALALANGLPPPPPLVLSSSDRLEISCIVS
jgi:hypothetical protein